MFIKICGVTTEEDALLAIGMGADAVGFNFVPGSVRAISPGKARDIAQRLPGGVITVGVFANERPERVIEIMDEARLNTAQLHGDETPADCVWISERVARMFKAFKAGDPALDRLAEYRASAVLMDGPEPGSGRMFDWRQLDGVGRGLPLILAGGLTPSNVAAAITQVRPFGVDVASGVELKPGIKDPLSVRQFITTARQMALELGLEVTNEATIDPAIPSRRIFDWSTE